MPETQAKIGEIRNGLRLVRLIYRGISLEAVAHVVLVAAGLGNQCLAVDSAVKTEVRPDSRIGTGCLLDDGPSFYHERTIFMAVGRKGYVGAVRVEDGTLNVAAALEPLWVRRHGGPGLAAEAILREAGFPPITGLERAPLAGDGRPHAPNPAAGRGAVILIGRCRRLCRTLYRRGDWLGPGFGPSRRALGSACHGGLGPANRARLVGALSPNHRATPTRLSGCGDGIAPAVVGRDWIRSSEPTSRVGGVCCAPFERPVIPDICEPQTW